MAKLDLTSDLPAFIDDNAQFQTPVSDEYLAGETAFLFSTREHFRRQMNLQRGEVLKADSVLGELLFRMKRKLSRTGRNGGWSKWLKQNKISRATADRLVLGFAESRGLTDELSHREFIEPLEGNVCIAAHRTCNRLETMLTSPRSRLTFMTVLGDLFELKVQYGESDSIRLTISPPEDPASIDCLVPNVIRIDDERGVVPEDYELKEAEAEVDYPL